MDMLIDIDRVGDLEVFIIVRMPYHKMHLTVVFQQRKECAAVFKVHIMPDGNMVVNDNHPVFGDVLQILPQPFYLVVLEAAGVIAAVGEKDIVEGYEMDFAAIPRVVCRAEHRGVGVGVAGRGGAAPGLVVVADDGKVGHGQRAGYIAHIGEQVGLVANRIAEHQSVAGQRRSLKKGFQIGQRFIFIAVDVRVRRYLRVADAHQRKIVFDVRAFFEIEIIALASLRNGGKKGCRTGSFACSVHRVCRRHGIKDDFCQRILFHLIDAVCIGLHTTVPIAHRHACHRVALQVNDRAIQIHSRLGGDGWMHGRIIRRVVFRFFATGKQGGRGR